MVIPWLSALFAERTRNPGFFAVRRPRKELMTMVASGKLCSLAAGLGCLALGILAPFPKATAANPGATVTPVRIEALANVPGKDLTAVVVTYPPGGSTPVHHHAGSVFAYVLSGAVRSQVSGQRSAKVYTAGESFFEPPGSTHLVSANASDTEPAKFLVVFIADKDAKLTTLGAAGKSR